MPSRCSGRGSGRKFAVPGATDSGYRGGAWNTGDTQRSVWRIRAFIGHTLSLRSHIRNLKKQLLILFNRRGNSSSEKISSLTEDVQRMDVEARLRPQDGLTCL